MRLAPRVPFRERIQVKCRKSWLKAQCEDISLFGVKLSFDRWDECVDQDWVKLKIQINGRYAVFNGRLYRRENGKAVILFNEDDHILSGILGRFFTETIRRSGVCPYCKSAIRSQ